MRADRPWLVLAQLDMTISCAVCRTAVMGKRKSRSCAGCRRLAQVVGQLQAKVRLLEEQLAAARKDSSTSSKPPSSDIVKPPRPEPTVGGVARQPGGQPGHAKHERGPFAPEQIARRFDHRPETCPDCGHT